MSAACRASNGAIPPVWWRCHRQARHAGVLVQRNSPRLVAVRSRLGAAPPKSQTTSVTNADNGVSWARWSALWAQWRLAWCVARTRTAEHVR